MIDALVAISLKPMCGAASRPLSLSLLSSSSSSVAVVVVLADVLVAVAVVGCTLSVSRRGYLTLCIPFLSLPVWHGALTLRSPSYFTHESRLAAAECTCRRHPVASRDIFRSCPEVPPWRAARCLFVLHSEDQHSKSLLAMDRLYDLPPRSASMPSTGTVFPVGYFQPLAGTAPLLGPTILPRKMSARRDSEMVLSEGPITPPESPGPEEMPMSLPTQGQNQSQAQMQLPLEIVMEDIPQVVQVEYPVTPVSQVPETPDAMEEDAMQNEQSLSIVRQPVRSLSQENLDLPGTSSLKLTDFDVRGTLGTGTFGRVLLVRLRNSPAQQDSANYFAMKILRKNEIVRLRQVEHVAAERYILSRIRHPFIVDLYATFQDDLNVYMLLSYVPGGELFTHLRRAQRFTPDVTRFYLATIVLALKYLHSFNIIYRDLKPENLLLDARGYLRLTDFGFAKIVEDRTWTLCGTPEYLAPEIIQSDGHGKAADWWACGILCYEMLVGFPPFFAETAYGIYEKILEGRIAWPRDMDPLSRELIKAFLHPDRSKRLGNMIGGPQDVLDHPWFRGVDWGALERREIKAPIIPHTNSSDDTRHFARLELPSEYDIPGLVPSDAPPLRPLQRYEHITYHYSSPFPV